MNQDSQFLHWRSEFTAPAPSVSVLSQQVYWKEEMAGIPHLIIVFLFSIQEFK
jgi:hypothetical protein